MRLRHLPLLMLPTLLAACSGNTIVPTYDTDNPNIQVGGDAPEDPAAEIEKAGSFCLEVREKWHKDGKTPDGKTLYAKDTQRKVVPCE